MNGEFVLLLPRVIAPQHHGARSCWFSGWDDNPLRHVLPGASYSLLRQLFVLSWRFSTAWWLPLLCLRSLPLFSFHLVSQFGLKERFFSQQSTIVLVLSDFDLFRSVRLRGLVESRERKREREKRQRAAVPAQAYLKGGGKGKHVPARGYYSA